MKVRDCDIILIGGSAGSLEVIIFLLRSLPRNFPLPVVLIIHRVKNTLSKLDKIIIKKTGISNITEPEDKEPVTPGTVYLAPQNYHLLVEKDGSFSLDYSERVNFSRPSIDVSFESFATVYGKRILAILLSGANRDGALGLQKVIVHGGLAVIQSPDTADHPAMPNAAIALNHAALIQTPDQILKCILHNSNKNH